MELETIIGLEIHIQLATQSKMFSPSRNSEELNEKPNHSIDVIDLGHPGTLPLINEEAVGLACTLAYALGMSVHSHTKFDRKHYFYPDLPKGYQITQYDQPLGTEGFLVYFYPTDEGYIEKTAGFERLHLEEDTAKSFHVEGKEATIAIDHNRSGKSLVEIVTCPDFRSPKEAKAFLEELQRVVRACGVSDAHMEKGQLRVDANISLRPKGENKLYPKTEIKNINSFRAVEKALLFQIEEQKKAWVEGNPPQCTRTVGWRDDENRTVLQRAKETAADYRYFPDPDVPPLSLSEQFLNHRKSLVPELPTATRKRFMSEYGLNYAAASLLTDTPYLIRFFEEVTSSLEERLSEQNDENQDIQRIAKTAYRWISTDILNFLNKSKIDFSQIPLTVEHFSEFLSHVSRGSITAFVGHRILSKMLSDKISYSQALEIVGGETSSEEQSLEDIVSQVIQENPKQVAEYHSGKKTIFAYFLGQIMRKSKGVFDPLQVRQLLERYLIK